MGNERLRQAMLEKGETFQSLAEALQVDPKTVERWVLSGRNPYSSNRFKLARILEADEVYLWPGSRTAEQLTGASASEIVNIYPHRWSAPRDAWSHIFDAAEAEIDILIYSGLFLSDDAGVRSILADKARSGVEIRILLGDPASPEVSQRGADEGIGDSMASKVRNAISLLRPLTRSEHVQIRLHATTLYNSIYRGDNDLLVNTHVYGHPASQAPLLHLRRVSGGTMVSTYLDSFNSVWDVARPLPPEA